MSVTTTTTWKCDRCRKTVVLTSDSARTNEPSDSPEDGYLGGRWFTVHLSDIGGYDGGETKHLCSKCTAAYGYFIWGWEVSEVEYAEVSE